MSHKYLTEYVPGTSFITFFLSPSHWEDRNVASALVKELQNAVRPKEKHLTQIRGRRNTRGGLLTK